MAAHRETGNFESLPWPRTVIDRETKRLKLDLRNGDIDVEYLEKVVRRSFRWNTGSIPFIPDEKFELLKLLRTNASMGSLEAHIRNGSELETQIIELANSNLYKGHSSVSTIRNAMVRLGMENLKFLIYQTVLTRTLFKSRQYDEWVNRLQFKAIASAHFAREIASWIGYPATEAYMAGLVHDIGEPYILQLFDALSVDIPDEICIQTVKQAHMETGATILRRLNISPAVVAACESHHNLSGMNQLASIICAATDQVCLFLDLLPMNYWDITPTKLPFRMLGINEEDTEIILVRCQDLMDKLLT